MDVREWKQSQYSRPKSGTAVPGKRQPVVQLSALRYGPTQHINVAASTVCSNFLVIERMQDDAHINQWPPARLLLDDPLSIVLDLNYSHRIVVESGER